MKQEESPIVMALDGLEPGKRNPRGAYTEDEGIAIIRSIREGVTPSRIETALGIAHGTLYTRLGRWAMIYARIPK